MNFDTAKLWHAALFTLRHIASALLIFGIIGFIAKPHAQDFVREAVDDRIEALEQQMDDVQREQTIQGADMNHLKELQKDTKDDTRMILQSLQGMRRELRDQ